MFIAETNARRAFRRWSSDPSVVTHFSNSVLVFVELVQREPLISHFNQAVDVCTSSLLRHSLIYLSASQRRVRLTHRLPVHHASCLQLKRELLKPVLDDNLHFSVTHARRLTFGWRSTASMRSQPPEASLGLLSLAHSDLSPLKPLKSADFAVKPAEGCRNSPSEAKLDTVRRLKH